MAAKSLVKTKRKFKSTKLFVVAGTILVSLLICLLCVGLTVRYEVDTETVDVKRIRYWKLDLPNEQNYWYEKGIVELKSVIVKKENRGEVENIVIFLVEGVNSDMLSKARFVRKENATELHNFVWDSFPHLGILKSSCSFEKECDAFTLATGLLGGVKTLKGLGGLDARAKAGSCLQLYNESYHINSIFKQAQTLSLRTGFVTTRRVTGPLVSALYAHSANTQWECDAFMSASSKTADCLDVASQLIKTRDGQKINVVMGGGRQTLVSHVAKLNLSAVDESACISQDGRNLLQAWQSFKTKENATFKLLQTTRDLEELKGSTRDYVLGIFANGDMRHDEDPELTTIITKSLDILKRNNSGFILVADTDITTEKVDIFQQKLFKLDETIKKTFKHNSFSPNNTILLTLFLDLKRKSDVPNDMLLYAIGPKSYLFSGVHDETYMAHVISYCLKMGIFKPATNSKRKLNF